MQRIREAKSEEKGENERGRSCYNFRGPWNVFPQLTHTSEVPVKSCLKIYIA